ncbi:MAG: lamin tail domain-containing protein, partial [Candidatus Aureabacteria bacterium]|nr:lamin tail domain-containing protein [Candidatus Auribacterota bacterium]
MTINEVNWGGTLESDTGEWIELFNSGSTVDLSDWVISVDNATTADWTFTLSGIAISDYLVLARGTDSTGGKADFIYPGADAFDDNGAIITLIDSYGQTQDTVSFSGGWPAGAQGISMERVTVGGSSWAAALVTALYGTLGIDRGTPRALNSVSSASGLVAGAATGNLKLQDYADWIDFEKGNYFKLFEWDLYKRPKST